MRRADIEVGKSYVIGPKRAVAQGRSGVVLKVVDIGEYIQGWDGESGLPLPPEPGGEDVLVVVEVDRRALVRFLKSRSPSSKTVTYALPAGEILCSLEEFESRSSAIVS